MFKHHKRPSKNYKPTTQLTLVRLIIALGLAGIETIWVIYISSFGLSNSIIGFLSSMLVIIGLIASLYSTSLLEKLNKYKILISSIILQIISYSIIILFPNLYILIFFSIVLTIISVFRVNSFDIIFIDKTDKKTLNQEEGLMYSLTNVGWLIGPLVAGFIMLKYNIASVFISTIIFMTIALAILMLIKTESPIKQRKQFDTNIIKNIRDYISNKKLRMPYIIGTGIYAWWALIYIYVPLFMIENGLANELVGIFLSVVMIPLVIFEYKVGQFSDKWGFKKFLFIGFLSLGIIGILAFLSNNIYLTLAILILASFAMATLEPLQDSFFFRQTKLNEEEKYYPIFGTSSYLGSFLGKFAIAGILLILPNNYAYLIIAIFMFIIAISILTLKEEKPKRYFV